MTTNKQELIDFKIVNYSNSLALILLTISLLALSLTAIFIKISVSQISANATVFNRLWIATIIFILWSSLKQVNTDSSEEKIEGREPYKTSDILFLILVAVVHIVGRFLWTWSLTKTSAANGTVLSNMTPIFSTLGGWLLFRQHFNSRFIIGLVLAIIGATVLTLDDILLASKSSIGDFAALASAIFYAASFLTIEHLRTKFSVTTILVWRCLLSTILILPVVLIFEDQILPISLSGWLAVICLAAICEVLGHGLVVYSLKSFSSAFVTIFLLLEPVIVAILAWFIFSESLSLLNLLGFAIIMVGIYLAKTGKGSDKV